MTTDRACKLTIIGGVDKDGNPELLERLDMRRGEIIGIVGPTGSGKSSLIADIEQFAKGGRQDLVEKEEAELKILQEFMPAQMSDEDVEALIKKAIADVGALSVKDMGKVMKVLMPQITGKADGKAAGEKVKALLSQ